MIRIENLSFHYADAPRPALDDVSLKIEDGEFVLITGPSGGGKSTLCRCLNGLVPHFYGGRMRGKVEVQGLDVARHATKELATKVGMVFQDPENQITATDVEREIAFGMENLGFPRALMARRLEESLDTLGIAALRHRPIHELSGGEKQKIAIASVLALHPSILVFDEPTSELDPKGAEDVLTTMRQLNEELGITVVLVEQRMDRVMHLVDRMIVLDGGRVVADAPPRELAARQEVEGLGVGLPPIVRLAQRVRGVGTHGNSIPLTVKEGRMMLGDIFSKAKPVPAHQDEEARGRPIIEVKNLWYAYPNQIIALKGVDLTISEGEFVAIMGRNASGKTTLAKNLNALLKPTKGKVRVGGVDTRDVTTAQLARKVGYLFQNPNDHLFAETVEEEIAFTLNNLGLGGHEAKAMIDGMLDFLNLTRYRREYPRSLSGGERQRVALASVLVSEPQVVILDEPTRGLEYRAKTELMTLLQDYKGKGKTVILITHDVEMVAEHADRVVLMSEGKVVVDGNKRQALSQALLFSPQVNRLVQAFQQQGIPQDILTADEAARILL